MASRLYRQHVKKANEAYDLHMEQRKLKQWELDGEPSDEEVASLIKFINGWATRYPSDPHSQASLKKAYGHVLPRLKLLEGCDIVEARLDSQVANGEMFSKTIQEVFETLAGAGTKHQWTGASKILHVLRPRLFVMWDTAIRGGYAVSESSEDYACLFLPRMQREVREAVGSYIMENNCGPRTAVQELEKRGGGRPITKLLDEYNYCRFTATPRCRFLELWE